MGVYMCDYTSVFSLGYKSSESQPHPFINHMYSVCVCDYTYTIVHVHVYIHCIHTLYITCVCICIGYSPVVGGSYGHITPGR